MLRGSGVGRLGIRVILENGKKREMIFGVVHCEQGRKTEMQLFLVPTS